MKDYFYKKYKELEKEYYEAASSPIRPILFIVGAPRSGTTLLYQLIASTGQFGYINNLLAGSWEFPVVTVSLLLRNYPLYDFKLFTADSEFGATKHPLAPHEFGYFWRRWLPIRHSGEELVESIIESKENAGVFRRCLGALEDVMQKPLVFKNLRVVSFIERISEILPMALFLWISRDSLFNAQSILIWKRVKWGGGTKWGPIRSPIYYSLIRELDEYEQAVAEVYYAGRVIKSSLAKIHRSRYFSLNYEELCLRPHEIVKKVLKFVHSKDTRVNPEVELSHIPCAFRVSNEWRLKAEEIEELQSCYSKYFNKVK